MKPRSVSVRPSQACFPQTSSYQVDPVVGSEDPAVGSGHSRWLSSRAAPCLFPLVSQLFKDGSFRNRPRRDGATRFSSGEVFLAACLSWVDRSEAVPHGSVLFLIRTRPFLPKQDQPGLFNPGEKPFISHLVETNIGRIPSLHK